jgi:anthranilate phosphoribosyltransferase
VRSAAARKAPAPSAEQACDLMSQLLDDKLSDLEKGGFALAMRIKGETAEELAGFMDAVRPRCCRWPRRPPRCCCPATTAPASCPT